MRARLVIWVAAAAVLGAGGAAVSGCGRQQPPDLVSGKELFSEKCGACHVLRRAGTAGAIGPNLDQAFDAARRAGLGEMTVDGVVRNQIAHPLKGSQMPADLVTGADARDVAAYVAMVAGQPGEDTGRLVQAGAAGATTGEQIFTAAGCNACHTLAQAGSQADAGPSLDDLAKVAGQRKGGLSPEEYVRESIADPDAFVVSGFQKGVMPGDYGDRLSKEQIDTLAAYLLGKGE